MESTAIFPGTFDPITLGHLDIVQRASGIFKHVILAVSTEGKDTMFSLDKRLGMARESLAGVENVGVESFDGLLIQYARQRGVHVIVRGIRAYSDFEFEFQRALMNRVVNNEIETIFIMTKEDYVYLNSSIVKEMAMFNGNVNGLVPEIVEEKLKVKFSKI